MDSRIEQIEGELYLSDNPMDFFTLGTARKSEVTVACICIAGEMQWEVNLRRIDTKAPGLLVLLPDRIRVLKSVSEDFQGKFILMTRRFTEEINLPENFATFMSVHSAPYIHFGPDALNGILQFSRMLSGVLRNKDEIFNRKAVAKHLTIAFFYALAPYLHKVAAVGKSRDEEVMDSFLQLVQKHYKQEHSLGFYSNRLCMTSKYLSSVVKKVSGKTAGKWIDYYIVMEAKSLLKDTEKTIQQIADELNFPSQSFFGKYFKREAGVSPSQYRAM